MSISMSEYPVSLPDRTAESSHGAQQRMRSPVALPIPNAPSTSGWKPMPMQDYLVAINRLPPPASTQHAAPSRRPSVTGPPRPPRLDTGRLPVVSPSATPQMQERCKITVSTGIPRPLPAVPPGMPMSPCANMAQPAPAEAGPSSSPLVPPPPPPALPQTSVTPVSHLDAQFAKLVVASPQPIHARQQQPPQIMQQNSEPSSPETPVIANSGYLSPPPGPRPLPAVPSPPPLLAPTPLRLGARPGPGPSAMRQAEVRDHLDTNWQTQVAGPSGSASTSNTPPKLANPTERVRFSHARSRSDQSEMFRDDVSIRPKSIRRRQSFTSNITDLSYASDSDETDTGYNEDEDEGLHRTLGDMGVLSSPVSDRTVDSPLHRHPREVEVEDEGAHPADVVNDDAMTEFGPSPISTRPLSTLVFSNISPAVDDFDNGYSPYSSRSSSPLSPIRYAPQVDSDDEFADGAGSDADSDVSSIMFGDNPSPTSGSPVDESPTSPIRLPTRARRRKSYSASTRSRRSLSSTRREPPIPRRRVRPSARRSHSVGSRDDLSFTSRRTSTFAAGLRDDFGGRYAGSAFQVDYDTPSTASTDHSHQPLLAPVRAPEVEKEKVGPPSSFMKFAPQLAEGGVVGSITYVTTGGKAKARGRSASRERKGQQEGENSKEREEKKKKRGRGVMGLSMGLTGGGKEKEGRDRSASGSIPPPPPASAPIGSRVAAQIHMMDSAVYHGSDAYHDDAAAHAHYVDTDGYPTQPLPGIKYATTRHAVSRSRSGLSIDTAHSGASSAESWRYGSREELFRQKEASKGEEVRLNKEDMYRVVNR